MPNPFCHVELSTDDLGAARKFYKSLFGWTLKDWQGGYTMIDVGKVKNGVGGGMQKKPMAQAPTAWLSYVMVDDVKKTLAKAVKGGATAVVDYMPVGDMGAIGIFVDPQGAALGLWETAKKPPKKAAAKKSAKKSAKAKAAPKKSAKAKAAPKKSAKAKPKKKKR